MSAPFFENAVARLEEDKLCLYFDSKFEFHYKKAQENKALVTLQKLVKEQFGNHLMLKLILGNPKDLAVDRKDSINDFEPSVERNQERSSFSEDLQEKLLQDPGIRVLVDELGAVIKNVD